MIDGPIAPELSGGGVRAGYREGNQGEQEGTYSVPGHVDGGDYHCIYIDGVDWVGENDGSCGIDGLASSCRALQG